MTVRPESDTVNNSIIFTGRLTYNVIVTVLNPVCDASCIFKSAILLLDKNYKVLYCVIVHIMP